MPWDLIDRPRDEDLPSLAELDEHDRAWALEALALSPTNRRDA